MTPNRRAVTVSLLAAMGLPLIPRHGGAQQQEVVFDLENMLPGDFTWHPERAPQGAVAVIASIPEQRVHVYRNGVRIGVSTCSTGGRGTRRRPASLPSCKRTPITGPRPTTTRQCRT
jgi:hypothetical protein